MLSNLEKYLETISSKKMEIDKEEEVNLKLNIKNYDYGNNDICNNNYVFWLCIFNL